MQSVCDITEDIKIGNTSIRQLINEAGDMNATPEQIALEYLIEGDPIEIKFDDEMSTSTASLRRLSEGASVSPRCFQHLLTLFTSIDPEHGRASLARIRMNQTSPLPFFLLPKATTTMKSRPRMQIYFSSMLQWLLISPKRTLMPMLPQSLRLTTYLRSLYLTS